MFAKLFDIIMSLLLLCFSAILALGIIVLIVGGIDFLLSAFFGIKLLDRFEHFHFRDLFRKKSQPTHDNYEHFRSHTKNKKIYDTPREEQKEEPKPTEAPKDNKVSAALKLFGFASEASFDEEALKATYKKLMKAFHPDKFSDSDSEAIKQIVTDQTQEINAAYNLLLSLKRP